MSEFISALQVFDVGSPSVYLRSTAVEKIWIMSFLLAIRDGQDRVSLSLSGEESRLWVEDFSGEHNLVPPPAKTIPALFEVIYRLGLPADKGPLAWLGVSEIISPIEVPAAWSSLFRLQLGDGLKQAKATASTNHSNRLLTIELNDVTISTDEASTMLARIIEERQAILDKKK